MQHLRSSDKSVYVMQFNSDGSGQRLFALDDCGDFVDVRVARSPNSYSTMLMDVDVARAAHEWLSRWLAAHGASTRLEAQP